MFDAVVYALIIVGQNGMETNVAQFATREQCLSEARLVIEQGPNAYCVPHNQITQADIQQRLNSMMNMMREISKDMDSK